MQMNSIASKARIRGIALVDLSIAILIGSTVLGSTMTMLTSSVDLEAERATQRAIGEARAAIAAYAQIHRRLPCPANPRLATADALAGLEVQRRGGKCEGGYFGALPWRTLGLPELDSWGTRLSYRVAHDLADGANECEDAAKDCLRLPTSSPSYTASADALAIREIRDPSGARTPETIAHGVAAVIVSHGQNRNFGFAANGSQHAVGGARYENDNADARAVAFYVRAAGAAAPRSSSAGTPTHDDMLGWLTRGEVLTAMVKAGHRQ
jgi:hypothetical protein